MKMLIALLSNEHIKTKNHVSDIKQAFLIMCQHEVENHNSYIEWINDITQIEGITISGQETNKLDNNKMIDALKEIFDKSNETFK